MNTSAIIAGIDLEIERLQQARQLLANADTNSDSPTPKRGKGRPKGSGNRVVPARAKRVLSEEARARIAAAQKKRWAAQKKAAK